MATSPPALVIPAGQSGAVLQFFRAITDRLEQLQGGRAVSDRAVTVGELSDLGLVKANTDKSLSVGPAVNSQTFADLMNPKDMEEYYKVEQVAGDHELLLYDWREKKFRRLDWALLGNIGIAWATCEEADAGVVETKAINPKVGACSYDRKRRWGQHEAGKGTRTVNLTDAASVTLDCHTSNVFLLLLGGNRTLLEFENPIDGQVIKLRMKQDATGGRTLAFPANVRWIAGAAPTLSTAPNAVDVAYLGYDEGDDVWEGSFLPDFTGSGTGWANFPAGPPGPPGADGAAGPTGPTGPAGVPAGGLTGEVLTKLSDTDYDAEWQSLGALTYSGLSDVNETGVVSGDTMVWDSATGKWIPAKVPGVMRGAAFVSSTALTTGVAPVSIHLARKANIKRIVIIGDVTGSVTVGIKKVASGSYTGPTSGTSIVASDPPTISSGSYVSKASFTGWTLTANADDILNISLTSVSLFTRVVVQIYFEEIN